MERVKSFFSFFFFPSSLKNTKETTTALDLTSELRPFYRHRRHSSRKQRKKKEKAKEKERKEREGKKEKERKKERRKEKLIHLPHDFPALLLFLFFHRKCKVANAVQNTWLQWRSIDRPLMGIFRQASTCHSFFLSFFLSSFFFLLSSLISLSFSHSLSVCFLFFFPSTPIANLYERSMGMMMKLWSQNVNACRQRGGGFPLRSDLKKKRKQLSIQFWRLFYQQFAREKERKRGKRRDFFRLRSFFLSPRSFFLSLFDTSISFFFQGESHKRWIVFSLFASSSSSPATSQPTTI